MTEKTFRLRAMVEVIRPGQWIKNLLVLVGLFFALADRFQLISFHDAFLRTMLALVLFCLVSGAVYIMNDLHDVNADRLHPEKKNRPIASGRLSPRIAVVEYFLLLGVSLGFSTLLGPRFAMCLASYFVLQTFYTYILKGWVLVDVFVIAIGFVIRVYSGTQAARVHASSWLLGCTFMVALFLILCKRYEEKVALGDRAAEHRAVLEKYDPAFLMHLITASAACTIIFYTLYTMAPQTVAKFGTERIIATVPFVVFGIFRYIYLVFSCGQGGRPERTLTRDRPLVVNFLLYVLACVLVMFSARYR